MTQITDTRTGRERTEQAFHGTRYVQRPAPFLCPWCHSACTAFLTSIALAPKGAGCNSCPWHQYDGQPNPLALLKEKTQWQSPPSDK